MTSVNHVQPWVQYSWVKCYVCSEIDVTTKTANHLEPSELTLNQQKSSETTQKPLKTTTPPRNEPPNLTLSFCCWLWTWFLNQESWIRKKWRKSSNDHELQKKTVNLFSQFWEITLKQVYNIYLNEIA